MAKKQILRKTNADFDGCIIKQMINDFVLRRKDRSISFASMGRLNYLSTLQFIDGVVGNSSSGLAEASTFNIGDRQKGRLQADSVIDCNPTKESILCALNTLYSNEFQDLLKQDKNPYGEGKATEKIMDILKTHPIPEELKKEFYDL